MSAVQQCQEQQCQDQQCQDQKCQDQQQPNGGAHICTGGEKLRYVFNKLLIDFIMSIKKESAELKALLRKNYRVIDNTSEEDVSRLVAYLSAAGHTRDSLLRPVSRETSTSILDALASCQVLKDCELQDISLRLSATYPREELAYNVYLLFLIAFLYDDAARAPDSQVDQLLEKVLSIVSRMQSRVHGEEEAAMLDEDLEGILDDDVRALLQNMRVLQEGLQQPQLKVTNNTNKSHNNDDTGDSGAAGKEEAGEEDAQMLEHIMDSKIGKLAAEISSEIDTSQLDTTNPADMLDFKKLADGSSPLGNIITKVGSKIQDKIRTGELSQGELLTEAMSMLKMFDKQNMLGNVMAGLQSASPSGSGSGAPDMASMFAQVQSMLSGGGGGPPPSAQGRDHHSGGAARAALRKRLEKRGGK